MKNELMYSFRDNNVRVIMKDNEPWFVMNDVCEVLDIKNPHDAYSRLEEHEKGVGITEGLTGKKNANIINEYGLYSLVFTSRKLEAREFKNWVTRDILPSIRKRGVYATEDFTKKALEDPQFMIDALTALKKEREEKELLEAEREKNKPKVLLAESIENSNDLILVRDLAVILKQNGIDIGQNRLYERLRDLGYLIKSGTSRNLPTQRSVELGLFRIVETTRNDGKYIMINKVAKVTGKGQKYFINKFLKEMKK